MADDMKNQSEPSLFDELAGTEDRNRDPARSSQEQSSTKAGDTSPKSTQALPSRTTPEQLEASRQRGPEFQRVRRRLAALKFELELKHLLGQ